MPPSTNPPFEYMLWQAALTISGGIAVYMLGQVFSKVVLEPAMELRKLIGEVSYWLVFYANLYGNVGTSPDKLARTDLQPKIETAAEKFRDLSAQLRAKAHALPCYWIAAWVRVLPRHAHLDRASSELIGISNTIYGWQAGDHNSANFSADEAKRLLGLPYSKRALEVSRKAVERRAG